jgi:periplasmic divalent cation tolerance protein
MTTPYIVVFVTTKDRTQARSIAKGLLESKLIACANILNAVESLFWWQGKIDQSRECLLILKTKKSLFSKLAQRVRQLHSYQTPEIIAMPISSGNSSYLTWIKNSTGKG